MLPVYKLSELENNVETILINNKENFDEYQAYLNNIKSLVKERPKMIWLITLVCAIFSLVSVFPALYSLYGIVFLPAQMLMIFSQINIFTNVSERLKNTKKINQRIEKSTMEVSNTAISCNNFIAKQIQNHIDNHKQKLSEGNKDNIQILADSLIMGYMKNGNLNTTRKDVLNYVVELLQYELNSDKVSIKILLEEYQEKVKFETRMIRSRRKNEK